MARGRLDAARVASAALLALALAACEPADDRAHAATRTDEPTTASGAPAAPSASGAGPAPSAAPPPPVEYESDELPEADLEPATLPEQRAAMVRRMRALGVVGDEGAAAVAALMASSKMMGQGNPAVTRHPLTRLECAERRRAAEVKDEKKPACGAPFMTPVWDPAVEDESSARVCIDRYEFPGLPCEYPVTWVTTAQAQALCQALGKRLCDAHEWEGACAGAVHAPEDEYAFGRPRQTMQGLHNLHREIRWAYGTEKDHAKCATQSQKSKGCDAPSFRHCGSNTSPAGAFPACRSPFGVYDLHGNAAEHMLLPRKPEELGARGGFGVPEMKGSWFIFQKLEAHKDDCRWRAPAWHDNEGRNHSNYHLGFRCCRDVVR
ncbi:MAG: SUMF1/EgtB/PvdO family nonheme iron enzyme [Polyangiaceae bacterium]|nr:SUMF1/EgtB/PvdO family nonheme iron enzyme [Polyangiaceae bacterium]